MSLLNSLLWCKKFGMSQCGNMHTNTTTTNSTTSFTTHSLSPCPVLSCLVLFSHMFLLNCSTCVWYPVCICTHTNHTGPLTCHASPLSLIFILHSRKSNSRFSPVPREWWLYLDFTVKMATDTIVLKVKKKKVIGMWARGCVCVHVGDFTDKDAFPRICFGWCYQRFALLLSS